MKTDENRAVASTSFVRLASPLAGRYCKFDAGEEVIIKHREHGTATVERAKWANSLTITTVLAGVPEHSICVLTDIERAARLLACDKPNDLDEGLRTPASETNTKAL